MAKWRWGEFGKIAVEMMAQAKAGETLLILADTWTDSDIAKHTIENKSRTYLYLNRTRLHRPK
jgi:hypothetical protein